MKTRISLYARCAWTLVRTVFIKIFNFGAFSSSVKEDFSASASISIKNGGKMKLGAGIHARRNVVFEADGGTLEIGGGCFFNNGSMIVAKKNVSIGSRVSFGPNVLVYDHDHDIHCGEKIHDSGFVTAAVSIGDDVWVGANSVILRGSVLGKGCVVGAGSVIKGTYPPYAVIIQKREQTVTERRNIEEKEVDTFV